MEVFSSAFVEAEKIGNTNLLFGILISLIHEQNHRNIYLLLQLML